MFSGLIPSRISSLHLTRLPNVRGAGKFHTHPVDGITEWNLVRFFSISPPIVTIVNWGPYLDPVVHVRLNPPINTMRYAKNITNQKLQTISQSQAYVLEHIRPAPTTHMQTESHSVPKKPVLPPIYSIVCESFTA